MAQIQLAHMLDIFVQVLLILFDRQHIRDLLIGNPLRNLLLAAHRINGDNAPGNFKHF